MDFNTTVDLAPLPLHRVISELTAAQERAKDQGSTEELYFDPLTWAVITKPQANALQAARSNCIGQVMRRGGQPSYQQIAVGGGARSGATG